MSASLVGSEMCIRDRSNFEQFRMISCAPSPKGLTSTGPPRGASGRGGGSVSYTHLTLPTICSV
eukprot:11636682-Alexandrium_andersonii.AAC.1